MRPALTIGLALVLLGCRSTKPTSAPAQRIVTDEIGRQVVLPARPLTRLISIAPNVTELLFALGLGDRVVGVDKYSDAPADRLTGLPRVGSNYEPSVEAIVGLRPDLVLTATSANRRETADLLTGLQVPVFATNTRLLADVFRTTRVLGELFGREKEAAALNTRTEAELAAVRKAVAGRAPVRTLIAVWDRPLYAAGRDTFVDDLLAVAGGENVAADARGFVVYPLEKILKAAPEIIIVPLHGRDEAPLAGWNRWVDLPAVRNHRVVSVEDALVSRAGPRVGEGARRLALVLHPDLDELAPEQTFDSGKPAP
jgi:iron complex transport system substrate-binding protein